MAIAAILTHGKSIVNGIKPFAVGLGYYHSYQHSRALAVGWKEQKALCTADHITAIAMLVTTLSENLEFLLGAKWKTRLGNLTKASWIAMPGLYFLTQKVEDTRLQEANFLKWDKEYLGEGTLGTRIESAITKRGYGRRGFEERFPKNPMSEDTLVARIDAAHAEAPRSRSQKALHDIANFTYLHISDAILFTFLAHSVSAAYFGFKRRDNLIQTTFCIWTLMEQGLFWTKPEENKGPLFKIGKGKLVRFYKPTLDRINAVVGPVFGFFYKGILGKIGFIASTTMRLAPHLLRKYLPNNGKPNACGFVPTPQVIAKTSVLNHWGLQHTEKHFEALVFEDQFPEQTLEDLENKLQQRLEEDSSEWMNIRDEAAEVTNRQKLEKFLGKDGEHGYLYQHVIDSKDDKEQQEKSLELKNLLGALLNDWENLRSQFLGYYGNLMCRTITSKTLSDLSLEIYPSLIAKTQGIETIQAAKNRLEQKISLILQQHREALFTAWCRKYREEGLESLPESVRSALVANIHSHNAFVSLFGKHLGLKSYQEAWRDYQLKLNTKLVPTDLVDLLATFITQYSDPEIKQKYDVTWKTVLLEAIESDADTRLDYEEVRDYLILRFGNSESLTEDRVFEYNKPTWINIGQKHELMGDAEAYAAGQKDFLNKYLNQVLFDTGFLTLRE